MLLTKLLQLGARQSFLTATTSCLSRSLSLMVDRASLGPRGAPLAVVQLLLCNRLVQAADRWSAYEAQLDTTLLTLRDYQ